MQIKWARVCTDTSVELKATGSTSTGAFTRLCVLEGGFGKAYSKASPFVSFYLFILVKNH
jgi:hypothetical protein